MAIYHFSVKTISRSDGRSAVAAAAYRSGEKLIDHRYGKEQDYTQKSGVDFTNIYAPENTNPELLEREKLWNAVEKSENRKDALLAREFEIAFPNELNAEQRKNMLNELCQNLVKRHGVIVDAAIHAPHTTSGSDERNYHAHIMFTTRAIDLETGLFSSKKYRDFSRDNGTQTVCHWREHFAGLANQHLEKAGHAARVDHRSYKERGLSLEATTHEGPEVTQLRRKGIETEISLKNDKIKQRNLDRMQLPGLIKGLDQQIVTTERLTQQLEAERLELEQQLEAERLELEQQRKAEQLQAELEQAYDDFIEQQAQYVDFSRRFYAMGRTTTKQLENLDKYLEKTQKWLSKQHDFYFSGGIFYDNYHHKPVDVSPPHFFTTKYDIEIKKNKVMKSYRRDVAKLFDDFGIEKTVSDLKQNAKKLDRHDIRLPVQKPTFMQRLTGEYVHSFDTLEDFAVDMLPTFKEYLAELSAAEKAERKRVADKRLDEQVQRNVAASKRKEEEELVLKRQAAMDASDLLKVRRLAAQKQPEKEKNLVNRHNNDYDPSM